jgi:hypothetical protein
MIINVDNICYRFPADPTRKAVWIQRVQIAGKGNQWRPSHNAKLCSLHFEERYIDRTCTDKNKLMTILKDCAVPSIFPNVS